MLSLWSRHQTEARDAGDRLRGAQRFEAERRHHLGARAAAAVRDVNNLFWVALTGAAWAARISAKDEEERRGPLVELAASVVLVLRWRHLKDQLVAAFRGDWPEAVDRSDGA